MKNKNSAKKDFKYEFVFSWFTKEPKCYEDFNFVGCKDVRAVVAMAAGMPRKAKYYCYTKKEADAKGIKPTVVCLGTCK
jgi:hypothetical protein